MNSIRQELEGFRNYILDAVKLAGQGNFVNSQDVSRKASDTKERIVEWFERLQEESKPVTWRDGAVEQWEPRTDKEQEEGMFYMWKDSEHPHVHWTKSPGFAFEEVFWLPASEFPMPKEPEPTIEPCPFCGSECASYKDHVVYGVNCTMCNYRAATACAEQEAIAAHNALYRKVMGA